MKKIIRIINILFMIILMLTILSCGNESSDKPANDDLNEAAQNEQPQAAEKEETDVISVLANLPEADYGGYEFKILTSNWFGADLEARQAPEEEQNGDPINDALYVRDKLIEDKYNIEIKYTVINDETQLLTTSNRVVKAGDDEFDFVLGNKMVVASGLSQNGAIYDFNVMPNVDLSKEWWSKYAIRDLTINGKFYFAAGDISARYPIAPYLMMFNKKVFADMGIEYPYQIVYDGNWTLDELMNLIKDKTRDLNGDGIFDKTDFYGMAVDGYPLSFMHSCGEGIIKIADGMPVLNIKNDRTLAVMDKLASFWSDPNYMVGSKKYVVYEEVKIFTEDRAMIVSTTVADVSLYKSMDSDFGVLPLPKYDANQPEYYSAVNPYASPSVCVLKTAGNIERTGMVIEALAAAGKYTSTPAVYDITLKTKYARDEDSAAMLDLICAGSRYDFATFYNWGDILTQFTNTFNDGSNFISKFESIEARVQAAMEKTIAVFESQ